MTMTRHLSTAGVTACAAVLVNLTVASAGGLDPQVLARSSVAGAASGARLDRTSRVFDLSDDEPSGSSPHVAILPRPFIADAAMLSRARSPGALASLPFRALDVLLVAPKHGPPASLA
jgi:hypothetical protein